ncbi:MAG: N-glycosylase [Nanoarchaeota archaeon]
MGTAQLKVEYNSKKNEIRERLSQFEKFFNEPYSWHYIDNNLKLLPSDKNDNERIFEELAFCIFTANNSAEEGLKSVDKVRNVLMKGSTYDMTRKLDGNRFNRIRPKYIVYTREHLKKFINFELRKKIDSLKDSKNDLRNFFVINVKGLGMKEASHFLRNIGFRGYAILDKHIMNSMREFGVLNENIKLTSKNYLEIEQKYKDFSKKIGIDMDELDLLLWSRKNGRILK